MQQIIHTTPQELLKGNEWDELRTEAYHVAMNAPKVESLLGIARDTKTRKSLDKAGVLTGVLYMAPAGISGYEMCLMRTPGCSKGCLFTAGHGTYTQIKRGRLRKTYQFIYRREEFLECLHAEVGKLAASAARKELIPAVRLNGTSDIAWEIYPVNDSEHIFDAHPGMQFYDYTKAYPRLLSCAGIPNYHLTFSYAETKHNRRNAAFALELGYNVAVVFDKLPNTYLGHQVIDGDDTDVRFWDQSSEPIVVGLTAKGKARKDFDSGFVVRSDA